MSNNYENHINLLGKHCTDKVTKFKGVITTIAFDLYGCVQAIVSPKVNKDGSTPESRYFDITRLDIEDTRVMDVPNFNEGYISEGYKGPSEKPLP